MLAIAGPVGALYSQDVGIVANVGSTTYNSSADSYTIAGVGPTSGVRRTLFNTRGSR
jgi:hypothetical protein